MVAIIRPPRRARKQEPRPAAWRVSGAVAHYPDRAAGRPLSNRTGATKGPKRPAGPYRQASPPPVRHRPGARSARRNRSPLPLSADRSSKETLTMGFRSFLNFVTFGSRRRPRGRRPAPCRPSVETLEARALPSVSFQSGGNYPTGGYNTMSVPTGDFNHDGAADLATVNIGNSTVAVLLGNGDGTFAAPVTYP